MNINSLILNDGNRIGKCRLTVPVNGETIDNIDGKIFKCAYSRRDERNRLIIDVETYDGLITSFIRLSNGDLEPIGQKENGK